MHGRKSSTSLRPCVSSDTGDWGGHRETQVSYIDRRLQMTSNDVYKLMLKRKMLYGISRTLRTRPFNQSEVIFRKWIFFFWSIFVVFVDAVVYRLSLMLYHWCIRIK